MGLTSNRPNCAKLWRCLINIALQTQVSLHCAVMKHQWSLYYLVTTTRRVASEQTRGRSVGSSDTWKALPTLSHTNDLSMTPCSLPRHWPSPHIACSLSPVRSPQLVASAVPSQAGPPRLPFLHTLGTPTGSPSPSVFLCFPQFKTSFPQPHYLWV